MRRRIAQGSGHQARPTYNPPVDVISVRGASEHNLKGIDVDLPRGALVVVSGVSGSGKSSLAHDTIYREAQRRYLETFSSYARQFLGRMSRPAVTSVDGLSPAIAVDQRSTLRHPRSTVGTLSGLHDDLRLLFARLGTAPPGTVLERQLFSFNSVHGACPACRGLGVEDRLDPELLIADPFRTIRQGALAITTPTGYVIYSQVTIDVLDQVCRAHGFDVDTPWAALTAEQRRVVLYGSDRIRIPYGKHPLASRLRWSGITAKPREEGVYKGILPVMEQILLRSRNRNILRFVRSMPCAACAGSRLRPEALVVRFREHDIGALSRLAIEDLCSFFDALRFGPSESPVGEPLRAEVLKRAGLLRELGLGHLALDRGSSSLSGGEAQRLRLASQLGSGLAGVLYVLDEPSIGLHAAEHARLLAVLRDLRDRGNTVLVVEHDEETIRGADWIVDVGPGPGQHGGELLFNGRVGDLIAKAASGGGSVTSRTAAFLAGIERAPRPVSRRPGDGLLILRAAARHNLRHLDVAFLARAFNVVTGVSGAGKSSLVEELIDRAGRGAIEGSPRVAKLIAVDQSPIGRTPRSNPATYTGLSDVIRDLLAATPEAAASGFGKGRFSFNLAGGRCEACGGAGVQQVGMHFLGHVDVVCDACGGRRFNDDTLEVRYRGLNIHDLLETTIEEAQAVLGGDRRAARILSVLNSLGLGYLRLGQPSTSLSGGEAQRIKLAAELSRPGRGHTVYVLDEPTSGLHVSEVAVLLSALDGLVRQGHTVITIEHHLDVVRAADRVIDLGPGGGRNGGQLVAIGTPEEVAACEASVTGAALRADRGGSEVPAEIPAPAGGAGDRAGTAQPITFTGVRTHNLQGIDVSIPPGQVTVITGVSGSGKSSLAFDTIYAEGRNRFIESFSAYARRFLEKPGDAEFDQVTGLTPAVAIRQGRPSRNPRSTVATMTEIGDYYRLLFARIGRREPHAVDSGQWSVASGSRAHSDGRDSPSSGPWSVASGSRAQSDGRDSQSPVPCPLSTVLTASMFSPNTEQGACTACKGLGSTVECDPSRLVTDPSRPLDGGALDGHKAGRFYGDPFGQHVATLRAAGRARGVDLSAPWVDLGPEARHLAMRGAGDEEFDVEWGYKRGARAGVHRFRSRWVGLAGLVEEEYARKHADRRGEALEPLMHRVGCRVCGGTRLRPERLEVRVAARHIAAWLALTVDEGLRLLAAIAGDPVAAGLSARDALVSRDLRDEVERRLVRLQEAGVGYLTLDREAATLSAGEAQRVRLATEVGSGLTGIVYVLDEPTAGLHPRDTARLLALVRRLRDAGNTVVVVEHDPDVIRAADHVLDLGPGAGEQGGRVVAAGAPHSIAEVPASATGRYLREGPLPSRGPVARPLVPGVRVRQARCHNLRGLDVDLPAGGLVAVTGVSGSGKSTLVFDVIAPAVSAVLSTRALTPLPGSSVETGFPRPERSRRRASAASIELAAPFARIVSSAGEATSGGAGSMTATLAGVFDRVRELFADTPEAREIGFGKKHFSLNAKGGRCEACEGLGRTRVSMDFLPDVWVPCEECSGRRYGRAALACRVDGRSIADVLDMTATDARASFSGEPDIANRLRVLEDLGIGYLRLGQAARTLSGGERQRLALAAELMREGGGPALFLFDEPTTGLHADDVARLLRVLDRLVQAGHTVVVVEHHLDVIAAADWVLDLGPEGGAGGGRLVASGTPAEVARTPGSWTGQALSAARLRRPGH